MAKLAQNFAKYLVRARMNAKGIVERPDIIGAIFGQTEGLLGSYLDLRELQRTGRIGRIEVDVKNNKGRSAAEILIPSSLDASETALIAASLETIDKVGPCDAEIEVEKVEDVRTQKRKYVIDRAKDILRGMTEDFSDSQKMSEMIKEAVRSYEVTNYHGLSCGPNITEADEIIIVEGRADVINLLRNGVKNVIAFEGSKIPEEVIKLTMEKTTTAFLDGDRGGDLDLKKLLAIADIDYICRAESGKEVEELTKKQIFKALRERITVDQVYDKKPEEKYDEQEIKEPAKEPRINVEDIDDEKMRFLHTLLEDIMGTRAAYLIDSSNQILSKVPISELAEMIENYPVNTIVMDGKVNQGLVDLALQKRVSCIVATDYKERISPGSIKILVRNDFIHEGGNKYAPSMVE